KKKAIVFITFPLLGIVTFIWESVVLWDRMNSLSETLNLLLGLVVSIAAVSVFIIIVLIGTYIDKYTYILQYDEKRYLVTVVNKNVFKYYIGGLGYKIVKYNRKNDRVKMMLSSQTHRLQRLLYNFDDVGYKMIDTRTQFEECMDRWGYKQGSTRYLRAEKAFNDGCKRKKNYDDFINPRDLYEGEILSYDKNKGRLQVQYVSGIVGKGYGRIGPACMLLNYKVKKLDSIKEVKLKKNKNNSNDLIDIISKIQQSSKTELNKKYGEDLDKYRDIFQDSENEKEYPIFKRIFAIYFLGGFVSILAITIIALPDDYKVYGALSLILWIFGNIFIINRISKIINKIKKSRTKNVESKDNDYGD
ncbi:MAG: hypothetical protein FWF56_03375, partial [Firmicutes bacterium]|nr:hypothetical protein [Bacillota bacterium]MCL1953701.1 hypothetical protein [Bacillota bacterium]